MRVRRQTGRGPATVLFTASTTRRLATAAITLMLVGACSPAKDDGSSRSTIPRGGTLRIAVRLDESDLAAPSFLDPQVSYTAEAFQFFRCCLARTLLTSGGRPTNRGGAELRPDAAVKLPTVSSDGLTWTFTLRRGLRYAPPLQNQEITSADFVRALQRTAKLGAPTEGFTGVGGYSQYYSVIQGFDQYAAGSASSIAGVQTPDAHTLVLRLIRPTGDLGYRLSLPSIAPIPPGPNGGPFGVADGHDKAYGRYVVSSGPYMIKGSEALRFDVPAKDQPRLAGIEAKRLTLVRNPSWRASTDPARPAYVDEIVMSASGDDVDALAAAVDKGSADLVMSYGLPPQAPVAQITRYRGDKSLGRVEVNRRDSVRYISMNLGMPPFDDVHVRKAMNLIVDKAALIDGAGGPLVGDITGHIGLDSSEQNLLINYDPYRTPGNKGSAELARAEMKLSRYDTDHDGLCDARACEDVAAYYFSFSERFTAMAPVVRASAAKIGIKVTLHGSETFFDDISPLDSKIPLALFPGWGKDYLNAAQFFEPLFAESNIGNTNYSFAGATDEQLRKAGYATRSVPSVDDRITDCQARIGRSQLECWAGLDQYLMEQVVPWVPVLAENHIQVIPARIANYSFDQATIAPALEQIALKAPPPSGGSS